MDSFFRHFPTFLILFIPLFYLLRGKLLLIFFIGLPILGELMQLNFPGNWNFCFEYQDILFNFTGAATGGLLCQIAKGVKKKQLLHR